MPSVSAQVALLQPNENLVNYTVVTTSTVSSRSSRSLQYEQHHSQFYEPSITYFDSTVQYNNSVGLGGESSEETTGSGGDSLIIFCALFVPLVIAISAILIIALLIKRMRRSESEETVVIDEENEKVTASTHTFHHYALEIPYGTPIPTHVPPQFPTLLFSKRSIPLPIILGLVVPGEEDDTIESSIVVFKDEIPKPELIHLSIAERLRLLLSFPKRRKEAAEEKKRFNIYTVSLETREQLKHIYVY